MGAFLTAARPTAYVGVIFFVFLAVPGCGPYALLLLRLSPWARRYYLRRRMTAVAGRPGLGPV